MATDLAPEGTRLTHRFADAVAWAASLHRDQARKGKPDVPYISHPIGVASLVLDDGGSEDEAIAALLHDVVEDCRISLEEIDHRFGPAVAAIVESTTDSLPGNTERGANDWSDRKRSYLEHLEQQDNPSALRVSAADKLYNVCDLVRDVETEGVETLQRFNAAAAELCWYYTALAEVFERRLPGQLADQLSGAVSAFVALVCSQSDQQR